MLNASLAFAKSIFRLFTEEIAERMPRDPHDYVFVLLIYVRTILPDEIEILKQQR